MPKNGNKLLNIKSLLLERGVHPKKRLGQNFLIDENVLQKIIDAAQLTANDVVLEIGPGLGVLTMELAKRVKQVIAVEKDRELAMALNNELKIMNIENLKVIQGDILKIFNSQFSISNYKVVANIPYYLTSPLIRKFLEMANKPDLMILMLQKEVAERICAAPPRMSLLSVAVQFYAQPKIISYVAKTAFYPVPKVDSAIVKIVPKAAPKINAEKFFTLVKTGFSAKRKMLKNNLSTLLETSQLDFAKAGLNPKCRAEELSVDDWIRLYTILTNKNLL